MAHLDRQEYEITLTIGIKESIFEYFSHARSALAAFAKYSRRHRELDFTKMRRFLHTTYKTMNEVDPDFMAIKLTKLYKNVETMSHIYDDFSTKSRGGLHSYERIFLQRQGDFTRFESLIKNNADEVTALRSQTEHFKELVAQEKDKLKGSPKFLSTRESRQENLKRLKRRENAAIVRLGYIMEENTILSEEIHSFRQRYEEEFMLAFNEYTKDLRPELLSVLNAMAFEFDVELWVKANDSTLIRNHFKNAYVGEVISSKTYLSYYLKSLDDTKLSSEHKELKELLDYLNNSTPTQCVLYMPAAHDLERFTSALNADDSGFVVQGFSDAKVALEQAFKTRIDILFLDLEAPIEVLENFLSLYRKNSKKRKKKAKIVLVSTDVDERIIRQAEKLEADSLVEREVDTVEIIDIVYDLLKIPVTD